MSSRQRIGSKWFYVALSLVGLLGLIMTLGALTGYLQRKDMMAVHHYVQRIQPQLEADPRFKEVRLLGYSCSGPGYSPYIPVAGTVPTKQDKEALEKFIRESNPPVYISVGTVGVLLRDETEKSP